MVHKGLKNFKCLRNTLKKCLTTRNRQAQRWLNYVNLGLCKVVKILKDWNIAKSEVADVDA